MRELDQRAAANGFRTDESMATAFRFWDSDLLLLAAQLQRTVRPNTLFCNHLLLAFQSSLVEDSVLVPETDPGKRCTFLWIEHLLTSGTWKSHQEVAHARETYEQLMESCLGCPGFWTHKVMKLLLDAGDQDFRRRWTRSCRASGAAVDLADSDTPPEDVEDTVAIDVVEGSWRPYQGIWTPRPIGQL